MNHLFTLLLLAIPFGFVCYGQNMVNTTGKSLNNTAIFIDYAIGEIAITTLQNSKQLATQGILQPNYQIMTDVNELFDKHHTFKAYPNPVNENLSIETDYLGFEVLIIYDIKGQFIYRIPFDYNPIDLNTLNSGVYIMKFHSKKFTKTLKIIKQ